MARRTIMSPKHATVHRSVPGVTLLAAAVCQMSGKRLRHLVNAGCRAPACSPADTGARPHGSQVTQIYEQTTATCTANAAHTGFDCDRAP